MKMRKSGFTLIELMVVIVMIGILAGVAIPKLFGISDRAKYCENVKSKTARYECDENARKIGGERLRVLVADGKRWKQGEPAELVETQTNTVVPAVVQQRTGYTIVNDNLVVFHSTDSLQRAPIGGPFGV
jgi:prepilin-type N-terminal cleavage/methylation domain-containing protein